MTAKVLGGAVDNGRRGTAVFPFYRGPVGIRERGQGKLEVAFFGASVKPKLPIEGLLDGQIVTVVEVAQSGLFETPGKARGAPTQAIVATVYPVSPE